MCLQKEDRGFQVVLPTGHVGYIRRGDQKNSEGKIEVFLPQEIIIDNELVTQSVWEQPGNLHILEVY